jgi:amyloid beta precursor protein binding protein 1
MFLEKEDALKPYTLIFVTAPITLSALRTISAYGKETRIPIIYTHSIGFYASFSLQIPYDFPIVDTHPDPTATTDLRLLKPWPALLEYADKKTQQLQTMDDHEHGHVPYLILILHYLEQWKQSHDGKLPLNFKEKNEFRAFINKEMRLDNPTAGEENYEQAVAAVMKNVVEPEPSSAVKEVFKAEECQNLSPMVSVCIL